MLKLYNDAELSRFIHDQAQRHFHEVKDQEDAASETWVALIEHKECPDARDFARRFIHRYYMRKWRLRKHEI